MDRVNSVRSTPHVEEATASSTRAAGSGDAPLPSLPPPSGPIASPYETIDGLAQIGTELTSALATGDPRVLMAAIARRMRTAQDNEATGELSSSQTAQTAELQAQMESYRKAEEAQASARTWGLLAKIAAYVGAAAAIIGGVVGTVFSGGTSTLGGIALAAVLISSAGTIALNIAQDSGWHDPVAQRWLGIAVGAVACIGAFCSIGGTALAIVGQAISATTQLIGVGTDALAAAHVIPELPPWAHMLIAGVGVAGALTAGIGSLQARAPAAGAAAAPNGQGAVNTVTAATRQLRAVGRIVNVVNEFVRDAALVAQGIGSGGQAAWTLDADNHHVDATRHRAAGDAAATRVEDTVEAMRQVAQCYARSMQRAIEVGDQIDDGRRVAGNWARA